MKKNIAIVAAFAALAACGAQEEPAPDAGETGDTTLDQTATGDVAGTYEVKMADGYIVIQTINPDGTYIDATADGTQTQHGTWRLGERGAMCFDPEGDEPEECYTGGAPGEDGSFESRDAKGRVTSSVRKVEMQTGAEAAPAE